jgi:sugar/nucleoside kinase (ribokinase family)
MATAMAACAALGLRAGYLGCVGNDHNGRAVTSELAFRGVDVSPVMTRECANRFAVITVDESSGDRIVLWDRDDRLNLSAPDIDIRLVSSARIVHVDDEDQHGAIAAAKAASEAGVIVTSDIDRVNGLTMQLIESVSIPIFAQHVLPQMTGESDPERGLRAVRGAHPDKPLCVTLGAAGAMMLDRDELIHEPGFVIQAFDTTGAGDVFRAGLIYALLNDYEPREMLRFANCAAALSCTRGGAMAGVPSLEDVKFFLSGA